MRAVRSKSSVELVAADKIFIVKEKNTRSRVEYVIGYVVVESLTFSTKII